MITIKGLGDLRPMQFGKGRLLYTVVQCIVIMIYNIRGINNV